ncbi:MAG TPA: gluconate 2-dehydrogenase subunit 3 family protein [Steroidobacteraceae bacterium]|nr:gluconate 2-dehydrogenase subunit 3 family protein [Steroidobacteraceae bacterium]
MSEPIRVDRRTTLKWVLAASAAMPLLQQGAFGAESPDAAAPAAQGYGTDPDLTKAYRPGELWPLTFTRAQRRTAAALCDVIIPADAESPSASAVGVVDFVDEWVSAPYPQPRQDRPVILEGLAWMNAEATRRFRTEFAGLNETEQRAICDDICYAPKAKDAYAEAAAFFARFRDLTAGGFYSTPAGRKDLKYVGNVPLAQFDGPPLEVLQKVGIAGGSN